MKHPPRNQMSNLKLSHLLLHQAAQLRRTINSALVRDCGITLPEKELLARLYHSGGQLRMSEVSNALMFTDGGATKLIGRLADRQFVTRQRSEEDKRVMLIDITDAGEAMLSEALIAMAAVVHPQLEDTFSSKERSMLTRLVEKLVDEV